MSKIIDTAKEILEDYPIYKKMPASISGKYHMGETQQKHLELAVNVMYHLCDEFNIHGIDKEILIASTYLHDIGLYIITADKKVDILDWEYFPETGYSRNRALMVLHPLIGASLMDKYKNKIDKVILEKIKRLISVHMSHWYSLCPKPITIEEHLICTADYVASRGKKILERPEHR